VHIHVDRDLCDGHGLCEGVAPDLFALDDDGVLQVEISDPPAELHHQAELAAANCPKLAITILD